MAAGFSGVDNPLFIAENTRMLLGDAKESLSHIVSEFND
jgi:NAD(P) transhydrogenase subunit beta